MSKTMKPTVRSAMTWSAQVLKLSSALFGVAAAGALVLPLVRPEEAKAPPEPRYVTLRPTLPPEAKPEPKARPTPEPEGNDSAPEEPSVEEPRIDEERSSFTGAILMVESQPPGASIRVNGVDQGETPVSVGLDCTPGRDLVVDFALRGFEKSRHRTRCPKDALVKVTARLRKASGKAPGKK